MLGAFIGALKRSLRWQVNREFDLRSVRDVQVGVLTFVQRADSAFRLNVHFHTWALDGMYVRDDAGELQFRELTGPTAEDVAQVAAWTVVLEQGESTPSAEAPRPQPRWHRDRH